jgi:hypothetical protein
MLTEDFFQAPRHDNEIRTDTKFAGGRYTEIHMPNAFGVFLLLVESPSLVTLRFVRRSHPKPEEPEILRRITFQLLKGAPVGRRFHFPKWAVRTGLRTGKTRQNVLGLSPHHRYLSVEPLEDRRLLAVGLGLGNPPCASQCQTLANPATGLTAEVQSGALPVTIQAAAAPTFNLTAPASATFTVGQTVPIQWTAGNVAAGSTIALCYDTGTFFGNATWITFSQTGADGNGAYNWNTTGVAPGTYYVGGYLYSGGTPYYSHLTQSITIQAAAPPTFNLTAPTSGTFTVGQTVPIQWTAANVAFGSTISLCYDTHAAWDDGVITWIEIDKVFGGDGNGTYNWNTTGVAPGTYYIAGYLYSSGAPYDCHLSQSITIQAAAVPTFNLAAPGPGSYTPGQTVQIQWTAGNVAAGSTIALCYDTGTTFGGATWITYNQAAADGNGTYSWNTTGVAPGTYYVGGYLYSGGAPTYSHLTQSITIQSAGAPTFNLTFPSSGSYTPGQTVQNQLTAGNEAAGSTIALCYDKGTSFGNVTWITFGQTGADGNGAYNWNTTGVATGTYYIGGYLYSGGKPYYSHLIQPITIQSAGATTFNLTAPTSGTFTAGQSVPIQWTADNVAAGSTICLCYDEGISFSNVTWITFNQAAANGNGAYNWNTAGVAPGTYYIGGYLYSDGAPYYSHLTQPITIQAAAAVTLAAPAFAPPAQSLPADADLPGMLLGEQTGKTIPVDRDAAGYGWFINPAPRDDLEFTPLASNVLAARPQSAADRRADLLTTVMHELGHELGDADDALGGLMDAALPLGVRRTLAVDNTLAAMYDR